MHICQGWEGEGELAGVDGGLGVVCVCRGWVEGWVIGGSGVAVVYKEKSLRKTIGGDFRNLQ